MKKLLALSFLALSTLASAEGPRFEPGPVINLDGAKNILEAVIANPKLVNEIAREQVGRITNVTRQGIQPGVTTYSFQANSCGNGLPKKAYVSIYEDLRPTHRDGAPIYSYTFQLE